MSGLLSAGRRLSRVSGGLVAAATVLLFIPALQPLLTARFTCGYDNVFHLWRAVEVEHLLRQGVLFTRWAPDMAHGLGFPLFLFMPYLSATVAALLHLLGLSWPLAVNGTFILGVVLGGLFMFLLARDLFGGSAAPLAAVAYVYAPFQAYDLFNRGSLSEAFAWAWPPLVVWALQRWTVGGERRFLFVGALGLAAFVLSHHLFAFLFLLLLMGWALLNVLLARDGAQGRTRLWRALVLGMLGLGLSAFFWLPALAERGWVQTDRLLGLWVFDYHYNFLRLSDLLALPRNADPALVNDWPPKALGFVPLLVGLLPLLRWWRLERTARAQVALLLALAVLFAFLTLSPSLPLWERLPLLAYVQFPWRFLGPAAFCLALLAGAAVAPAARAMDGRRPSTVLLASLRAALRPPSTFGWRSALLLSLLFFSNLGWFYPDHCPAPADTSLAGLIAWERETDTLGTTARGEYLPIWVERMPPGDVLQAAYEIGGPVARLDPTGLPDGARVLRAEYGTLNATIELESPQPFRARYLALYYPGWQVRVDGEPVSVAPSNPEGLLTFDVPAGEHTVNVRFTETPLRLVADAISLLSLLVLLIILSLSPRSRVPASPRLRVSATPCFPLTLTALLLVALKLGVVDRFDSPLRHTRLQDGHLAGVEVASTMTFDGQFRLLGYGALPESIAADDGLEVRLYWQDTLPGGPDYRVGLTLEDEDGLRWSESELRVPRWHRAPPSSATWPADGYALTAFEVRPLSGAPPGVYTVTLGVFDGETLAPYAASGVGGQPLGLYVPLGQVELTRPRRPLAQGDAQYPADAALGPLRLVGYNLDRAEAAPGDPFLMTLFWRAEEAPGDDLRLHLTLRPQTWNLEPETWNLELSSFPTVRWRQGDLWRGQYAFRLPASLESGAYRWEIALYRDGETLGQPLTLGMLQVDAPERRWTAPPLDVETNSRLGDVVTLLGANLQPETLRPGTPLTVTLVWRAEAEMETSYRVFLHLVGPDGLLVAQSDGEPANWTRPTTGWLPGEVVLDERVLTVPEDALAGEHRLQAGVYTLEAGRLYTPQGLDAVPVAVVEVR